jgi:hypothetical protein
LNTLYPALLLGRAAVQTKYVEVSYDILRPFELSSAATAAPAASAAAA